MIRVRVVHQTDPGGPITGGIDSVIRGILKYAPHGVEYSVIGLTSDPVARPVGAWTSVAVSPDTTIKFFAVGRMGQPMQRKGLPQSVKVAIGLLRYWRQVVAEADVFEVHRIEPALCLQFARLPISMIIHQNMSVLQDGGGEIGWRYAPWLYFTLERWIVSVVGRLYCVRSDAVEMYKRKFPQESRKFHFLPTWFDGKVFGAPTVQERSELRRVALGAYGISQDAVVFIAVGRLDKQKNPLLIVRAFADFVARNSNAALILVGDGVLAEEVRSLAHEMGVASKVKMAGIMAPVDISKLLKCCDAYVMASLYEGMPISVLEAMASGLVVASTAVGEIPRVVKEGEGGYLVHDEDPASLSSAMQLCLSRSYEVRSPFALRAVEPFRPENVLRVVYEGYDKLTGSMR